MGSTTEHSAFHITRNPHNTLLVPGGTSGGSAAAVAASEAVVALGSDTGGSIRQPAAFCGVVGMKPTYGRVSRYGLVAYASSFDQIGPLARDVSDAALLLSVIAGRDPMDSTAAAVNVPNYCDALNLDGQLRIGVPFDYLGAGLDSEIRSAIEQAIKLCQTAGHSIVPITLSQNSYALSAYYVLVCSEASSNLARYDGVRYGYRATNYEELRDMYTKTRTEGFGEEVRRRILLGTYCLSAGYYDAYYTKAAKARAVIGTEFRSAFEKCDVVMHPVTPTPPFEIGSKIVDPMSMYLADIYTVIANLAGVPAISIPCGRTKTGLPIGVQLAANVFEESKLLAAALELERLLSNAGMWRRSSKQSEQRNVE
jgi:aspartyl-tRNA(Asn)/glutamyl-tRNA(Gln) amidotransferase subunit A